MNLKSLEIRNFGGVQELLFEPNGSNAEIIGDNDTGKTTIANAYHWLIFGTNAAATPNFSPKPNGRDGKPLHRLTTSVEGVFILPKGSVKLRREMVEKWGAKRGTAESVFKSNEFPLYIDDTPVTTSEFNKRIADLIGDEREMKCSTSPGYFARNLDMKQRRAMLFSLADLDDRSDYDIAQRHGDLAAFTAAAVKPDGVNHYTVDEVRAKYKPLLKKANETLAGIPGRVDEANRAIPGDLPTDVSAIENVLKSLRAQKSGLETQLNGSKDEAVSAAHRAVEEHKTAIVIARNAHNQELGEKREAHNQKVNELKRTRREHCESVSELKKKIAGLDSEIHHLEEQRDKLRKSYDDNRNSQYDGPTEWAGDEVCPTCNREFDVGDIEQWKAQFYDRVKYAVETFNQEKSNKAVEINVDGQNITNTIEAKKKEQHSLEEKITALEKAIEETDVDGQLDLLEKSTHFVGFEETDEYKKLAQELQRLEDNRFNANASHATVIEPLQEKICGIETKITATMQKIATLP